MIKHCKTNTCDYENELQLVPNGSESVPNWFQLVPNRFQLVPMRSEQVPIGSKFGLGAVVQVAYVNMASTNCSGSKGSTSS